MWGWRRGTYARAVAAALDAVPDRATNGAHGEGSAGVVQDDPWAGVAGMVGGNHGGVCAKRSKELSVPSRLGLGVDERVAPAQIFLLCWAGGQAGGWRWGRGRGDVNDVRRCLLLFSCARVCPATGTLLFRPPPRNCLWRDSRKKKSGSGKEGGVGAGSRGRGTGPVSARAAASAPVWFFVRARVSLFFRLYFFRGRRAAGLSRVCASAHRGKAKRRRRRN